jgi:hypothetical protein
MKMTGLIPIGRGGPILAALGRVTLLAALLFATLPGFAVDKLGTANGFVTSIVTDSRGRIYYTTTSGAIARFPENTIVAKVATDAIGNSGLLGMALRDDDTAIIHYTRPKQTHDVIAAVSLTTGKETLVHEFVCNQFDPAFGVSSEHHGGNPIVTEDGSIFVAIGDSYSAASAPQVGWNLGKVFRIHPDGRVEQFARGVRNPFDIAWDAKSQRLIVPDNGDKGNDEINIVTAGSDLGWPFSMPGHLAPVYTFPNTVAPTGFVRLRDGDRLLSGGYLLAGFVPRALYYINDVERPDPIAVIDGVTEPIVDVTEAPDGTVYFAAARSIYRLRIPQRGDCDGDGLIAWKDVPVLMAEAGDGGDHPSIEAQDGAIRASWGCDVDGDGLIRANDVSLLKAWLSPRSRTVR